AAALVSGTAMAESFNFKPIDSSVEADFWTQQAPWKLPKGFVQKVVSDESDLNIYDNGRDDWNDMNTVNETGNKPGKYLYRTHEVRDQDEGGAVSVVNLETGEAGILAQDPSWNAVDGIRWTPWGTILFAEEVDNGRLFEIELFPDMVSGEVIERPAVGLLAHEGIEVDEEGNVYVVDEFRGQRDGFGGGVYKFVPDNYGDLSAGSLYVLKVTGNDDGTGQGEWAGPIDPANARQSGTDNGGHGYNRPEDLEIIGNTLYVAVTEGIYVGGSQTFDGRVLAINLDTLEVSNFVKPGENAPIEIGTPGDANFQTGFDNPDNLAESPDGRLVIVEDNVPSDIWFAEDKNGDGIADRIELFASLSDYGAEGTGIYFNPEEPKTLFVNIQHSKEQDGDGTWAISKQPDEAK
ncbi:MAG: alkaline phosphatase PhoX, partial [Gammaproteobacteria bacterium]